MSPSFEERIEIRSMYQSGASLATLCVLFDICEYQCRRILGMDFLPSLQKCLHCRECWG